MSLVTYKNRWSDYAPIAFNQLVDRLLKDGTDWKGGSTFSFVPQVDVLESGKAFEIQLAVPGVEKDNFKINLEDQILTISGERKLAAEKEERDFHFQETQYGTFSRSFTLPESVNTEKIEASYQDGILRVVLPKDEKKVLKTTIPVN